MPDTLRPRCRFCTSYRVRHVGPKRQCLFASTYYEPMTSTEHSAYLDKMIAADPIVCLLRDWLDRPSEGKELLRNIPVAKGDTTHDEKGST